MRKASMSLASERPIHTLGKQRGMRVDVSARGATLLSWWAPDRDGRVADVLLGYPDAQG